MFDSTVLAILTPALALVGGLAGSLIAPVVQWSIEKRRGKAAYRREMIARWRKAIDVHDFHDRWIEGVPFGRTAEYAEMRQYIRPTLVSALEDERANFPTAHGRGGYGERTQLLDSIAELEREWGLL